MQKLCYVQIKILAKKLIDISPPGLKKVFYSGDGASAVEVAIKMAFQYWMIKGRSEKKKFVCLEDGYHGSTETLLNQLGSRFTDTNFIGIRVLAPRDSNSFIRRYTDDYMEVEKLVAKWKKTKTVSLKGSGYDTYFGLSSTALSQDTDFFVKEDATKGQIKSAFVKSLRTKKMNKNKDGIYIYNEDAYKGIKKACNLASKTLDMISQFIEPGVTTEELDKKCHDFIVAHNSVPATLGYRGYPKSCCISIEP